MKLTIDIHSPCHHAMERLDKIAIKKKLYSTKWAVIHPQHAGFPTIFKTKREADSYKKQHASAYIVCRVAVVPLYGKLK